MRGPLQEAHAAPQYRGEGRQAGSLQVSIHVQEQGMVVEQVLPSDGGMNIMLNMHTQ